MIQVDKRRSRLPHALSLSIYDDEGKIYVLKSSNLYEHKDIGLKISTTGLNRGIVSGLDAENKSNPSAEDEPCIEILLSLSLCMENTSYVFSFRMVFFYLVTKGWISDISL